MKGKEELSEEVQSEEKFERKTESLHAKESEIKRAYLSRKFNVSYHENSLPFGDDSHLDELEDVIPKEAPQGLMTCMVPQRYDNSSSTFNTLFVELHESCYLSKVPKFEGLIDELHDLEHGNPREQCKTKVHANGKGDWNANQIAHLGIDVRPKEMHGKLSDKIDNAFFVVWPTLLQSLENKYYDNGAVLYSHDVTLTNRD